MAVYRRTGGLARNLGGKFERAFAVLVFSLAAVANSHSPVAHASSVHTVAHANSCPIARQCGVNLKTSCPTMGPLQPSAPQKCVAIPVKTFWVSKTVAGAGNTGCQSELIVQVLVPANSDEYEAVVYSNIGLGTRWWSTPDPGGEPGHTIANGAATYTVPAGYHAWQVAGGVSWSVQCSSTFPAQNWLGDGAWALTTSLVAGAGTIKIHGPTKNKLQRPFKETVSGTAGGAANYVVSGEQLSKAGGCASTLKAESAKSNWHRWPTGTGQVHGNFLLVARFYAADPGQHGMCSYLINRGTLQTYTYTHRWWTNS